MPGFDRTGPEGQGSRSGRGLGKCNPNNKLLHPTEDNTSFPTPGRRNGNGFGKSSGNDTGRGFGRKMRRGNY